MSISTLLVSGQFVLGHPMYIWSTTVLQDMNNLLIGTQVSTLILQSRSNQTQPGLLSIIILDWESMLGQFSKTSH